MRLLLPFSHTKPNTQTQPQALRIMATPLALTMLREAGGAVVAACARRPHFLRRAASSFHHKVRPYSSTASSTHSITTTHSTSVPALSTLLAAAAAAAVAATSLSSPSQCETTQTKEESGEGKAIKEATATATATSAPSFSEHHDRVDTKLHRAYPEFLKFHLIHETLRGKEKIEGYEVYKDRRDDSVVAFARLGKLLSGHPDIIHGGSIAALLDNTMGVAFFAAKRGNGFTANLTINYKRPITCGTEVKILARVERVEGRKVFLRAEIRNAKDDTVLYTEATSLFITSQSPLLTGPKKIDIS